jgi:hypothetical protein
MGEGYYCTNLGCLRELETFDEPCPYCGEIFPLEMVRFPWQTIAVGLTVSLFLWYLIIRFLVWVF